MYLLLLLYFNSFLPFLLKLLSNLLITCINIKTGWQMVWTQEYQLFFLHDCVRVVRVLVVRDILTTWVVKSSSESRAVVIFRVRSGCNTRNWKAVFSITGCWSTQKTAIQSTQLMQRVMLLWILPSGSTATLKITEERVGNILSSLEEDALWPTMHKFIIKKLAYSADKHCTISCTNPLH